MKFGFEGLNKGLNSNLGTLSSNLGFTKEALNNSIIVGRVIDIVLDEQHKNFNQLGEYNSFGTIEFINTTFNSPNITPGSSGLYARPLDPNVKNYPLFNEIVYIFSLPGINVMEDGGKKQFYYLKPINVWNHPHHNAVPFFQTVNKNNTQNKTYQITTLGSVNKTKSEESKIDLGPGFKEYSNIKPLRSYLGDYIIEGRWGNSIRFGSTINNSSNTWSTSGENGNPIIIIRNGQSSDSDKEGYKPTLEDINKDLSSIWFTSNQIIPIKVSSKNYQSYKNAPASPDQFNGAQNIFNSERLLFNSTKDHILLSSKKSIGLNSIESINIDTKEFISGAKINKLGDKDTTNPMLKGNETIMVLDTICSSLIKLSQTLSTLAEILPTAPQANVNIAASETVAQLKILKGNLQNLKSKNNFLI